MTISVKEKDAVFAAADEQLAARMLAARVDQPTAGLIRQTFNKLDIEAIASKHIGELEKEAVSVRADYKSSDIGKRVKARVKLRASIELRVWRAGKAAGIQIENDKLMKNYKTVKGVN